MEIEDEITAEEANEIEAEATTMKRPRRPRSMGVILTVFAAVIVVLVGGLASYYYYTFQRQGVVSEQELRDVWDETVLVTVTLTNRFQTVDKFEQIDASGKNSFVEALNDANRTVRDGMFSLRNQAGLGVDASTFASKFNSFLDDYGGMLTELRRIIDRKSEIDSLTALDQLLADKDAMEKSYDDLLLVSRGFIQANLPRAIFDLPGSISDLLKKQLDEQGTQDEQTKAARQAAEGVVTQFAQAWQDRDGGAMTKLLTAGAKREFNQGILEDSSDITSFRIITTDLPDPAKAEIDSQLTKETPDGVTKTESWHFVVLKDGAGNWLIDTWQAK
ncbi:TPA: hypothetical protein DHW58_01800 [Patescibacteria group bacterium]|uniref:Uncharacterized protein n=2 Tax=Bacteria division Kazan-3B-28 TaxID=1798534 RepID=A0A0G1X6Q3_UNCK3|nr:MAG: hypothetical protein VE98_C0001G0192 [candidate division Kazan bacterium GW2011_GWA1_50_15]KKW25532.1 MAG: hypothetical protein VE99_C0001G0169 [candidate division Kazan bacterium GW2011_GWC1_52_13]KKW26838.1 MAG: hypothetical protein VF00_C0002G0163 [candidate division Kazan bacterium GW2011_GWB1_52_7]HAV65831.1 hypothetical protein [Patescibacteria group bacterium]HCL47704.1 hypothetical protein [Patescibacteria group bacterium]